jgi:serine protease inhibitor ecotin
VRGVVLALLLAACSQSSGDAAAERYTMLSRSLPWPDEKCRAAREVAQAYLNDQNETKYREWRNKAAVDCTRD